MKKRARGFTYLGLLFIMALLSMTAAMASVVWRTVQQREDERELVFVGRQFQAAIERYRQQAAGGGAPQYPRSLRDLVQDPRSLMPRRHLRKIYVDPMTQGTEWGLIRLPDGGIVGVYSLSARAPIARSVVAAGLAFPHAVSYRDWRFVAPSAADLVRAPARAGGPPAVPLPPGRAPVRGGEAAMPAAPEDPPPVTVVPRPSQRDYRTRTPEACARITAFDEQVCREQAERFDDEAAAACRESAVARSVACTFPDNGPLPDLVTRD